MNLRGRAIGQAVTCRLPTAAARVRTQVMSSGICGEQSGTEVGFLGLLRFPLSILILSTAPHSSSSSAAGTIGQLVADVPSGLSLAPPKETKKNYIVTDWSVSRRRLGKHVPTNTHPTIEGRPLIGNDWVSTPDNIWYPLLSSWCVCCGWSVLSLHAPSCHSNYA
jgi:hypothetical protein